MPPVAIRERAAALLRVLVPNADKIEVIVHDETVFVDQGENFEEVRCSSCEQSLDVGWWQHAMEAAGEASFVDLTIVVPCCGSATSLNELDYRWPAGFARFVLEASEPELRDYLDDTKVAQLEVLLGQPVRQILARY